MREYTMKRRDSNFELIGMSPVFFDNTMLVISANAVAALLFIVVCIVWKIGQNRRREHTLNKIVATLSRFINLNTLISFLLLSLTYIVAMAGFSQVVPYESAGVFRMSKFTASAAFIVTFILLYTIA
jgi:hypothetical protein